MMAGKKVGETMSCPICDKKPANCDCSAGTILLQVKVDSLKAENAELAQKLDSANAKLVESEKLKQGYYDEAAKGWQKFRETELQNNALLLAMKEALMRPENWREAINTALNDLSKRRPDEFWKPGGAQDVLDQALISQDVTEKRKCLTTGCVGIVVDPPSGKEARLYCPACRGEMGL